MSQPLTSPQSSKLLRAAIWVAIGSLIAAALVCVVWVLIGPESGIVARAFLTVLLLAAFAGISILESHLAPRRAAWFALTSMVTWVIILLIGATMIWMPYADWMYGWGAGRVMRFFLIVLILQLALLHLRLFTKAHARNPTTFISIVTYATLGFVWVVAVMLTIPLVLQEYATFLPIYWRVVVALSILAAVGTALVPLVNALLAPRDRTPAAASWPTYADGRTPLPQLADGSPDWQAYYTGRPTYPGGYAPTAPASGYTPAHPGYAAPAYTQPASSAQPAPAATSAPTAPPAAPTAPQSAPGYAAYPPPPPLPTQPPAPQ